MSLILLIDTSTDKPMAALADKGKVIHIQKGETGTGFSVHRAAASLFEKAGKGPADLEAVSVISGPGSYTGLRVGLAAAKGLCFAMKKNLISVGSLEVMAKAVIDNQPEADSKLYCPMLDARRDEVFTAIYDSLLNEINKPGAVILNSGSFSIEARKHRILFFGSGAAKWKNISGFSPEILENDLDISGAFALLSNQKLSAGLFDNLVAREPDYLKEFFFLR